LTVVDTDVRPRRRGRLKWTVGIVLIVTGIGGLAAWAIASPGAVSYYTTPSEVSVQGAKAMGHQLRVGGRVAAGSLHRDGTTVTFSVTDGHNAVLVLYHGDVPDTLKAGTDVVAEGLLQPSGTLVATRVLAKCSSKFTPENGKRPYGSGGARPSN
jgi:cytochrome c-type biogenesis protein CcmE